MTPIETLLAKLPDAKPSGKGWSARCPAHDDRKASLTVTACEDGTTLVKCHAGCTTIAILSAVEMKLADLFPAKCASVDKAKPTHFRSANGGPESRPKDASIVKPKPTGNRVVKHFPTADDALAALERQLGPKSAFWTYHDVHGEAVGYVVRWDRPECKDIRPLAWHSDGWRIGAMPEPRPLYGLPTLAMAPRVIVCEGEKATDAARAIGYTATTSAGGAQAATKTDWRPLAGKEVWLLPDNDPAGRTYAETVETLLAKLTPAPTVKTIELSDLPEGGDLVDWIEAHGDAAEPNGLRAELEALAETIAPDTAANDAEGYTPFPVVVLPEPVRGFVTAGAKSIGCDASYLALPLLTVMASAIGTTRRLELKRGWTVPAILWTVIVGESGTAKTPAFKLVMRPIHERQRQGLEQHAQAMQQYDANLACWEKQFTTWKRKRNEADAPPPKPEMPACERFLVSDTTVEALAPILLANPRGLLMSRDELSGWFGSFDRYAGKGKASADAANWLSMFNAESITVDRKTGTPRTIHVPEAAVCVCGGIQPGILFRALGEEHRESGLAARLLLAHPPRRAKRWTESDIDPNAEADIAALVDRLFDLQPMMNDNGQPIPGLVRLTPEAKSAWTAYYDAHSIELADLTGDMAAAWSKLEEYAARLALVVHFMRCAAGEVADELHMDAASMNAGITLATWFKKEARRVYAMFSETDGEREQRRLVEWIGRKGGTVTARAAQQGCRWLKEPGTAEAALEVLVKAGRGTWQVSPITSKGGRPARSFTLNAAPAVYETITSEAEIEVS